MKIFILRMWAIWRRFRRGASRQQQYLQYAPQVEALMNRANPFASWIDRASWMIDVAEWLRHERKMSLLEEGAWRRAKHRRARFLLDWLDSHRDVRRVVQATLQKTLRESVGPELFGATGMPRESAFFSELAERIGRFFLPRPPMKTDLSTLFTAIFPEPSDAQWLLDLDQRTLKRFWKLAADQSITHNYRRQIDEALFYLATMVIATGISPAFRERLQPKLPLQATPFFSLRRELEKYLAGSPQDEAAVRSVRMLLAVCQAQTDHIYAHLDEYGVSVGLVYHTEKMRSQLTRMARLIDLRSATPGTMQEAAQVQALLAELIHTTHHRASVQGLMRRSFSLHARKMVERNAKQDEQLAARNKAEYRSLIKAGCVGGAIASLAVMAQFVLPEFRSARFFDGLLASLSYLICLGAMSMLGGALATRQSPALAPVLAARMGALNSSEGLRGLLLQIGSLTRSQAAVLFGNLLMLVPIMLALCFAIGALSGGPALNAEQAQASLRSLSAVGFTPLYAAFTSLLLWAASLLAGFADNWFVLRGMREAIRHHRRFSRIVGPVRAGRCAAWIESHIADIAGTVALSLLFGMAPVVAQFFDVPFEVRHITFATGTLAAAAGSLGWHALAMPQFWLGAAGVFLTALLNIGVAFFGALALALHAREVPPRSRRLVWRALARRMLSAPGFYFFSPPQENDADKAAIESGPQEVEKPPKIRRR